MNLLSIPTQLQLNVCDFTRTVSEVAVISIKLMPVSQHVTSESRVIGDSPKFKNFYG